MTKKPTTQELFELLNNALDTLTKLKESHEPTPITLKDVRINVEPGYDEDTMDCIKSIALGLKVNAEAFKVLALNVRAEPIKSVIHIDQQGQPRIDGEQI